MMGWFLSEKG